MNLFLAPGTPENERASLSRTIDFEIAERFLKPADVNGLKKVLGERTSFHCFAMKEGSRAHFERMEPNDEVLFFIRGTGLGRYHARIIFKAESGEFGKHVWSYDAPDWKLIYFLHNVVPISLNKWELLSAFGYDNPNDSLSGIRPVRDECVREIFENYGSVEQFLRAVDANSRSKPLRLMCAHSSAAFRPRTSYRSRKPATTINERDALRVCIEKSGCAMPPATDVPKLVQEVSKRVSATHLSILDCAEQVLEEYRVSKKL